MKAPQVKDLPQEDQDRIHVFDVTMDAALAEGRTLAEAHAGALRAVVSQALAATYPIGTAAAIAAEAQPQEDPDAWPFE